MNDKHAPHLLPCGHDKEHYYFHPALRGGARNRCKICDYHHQIKMNEVSCETAYPFCFIPHYQYEGDSAFGEWAYKDRHYILGDGDCYTAKDIVEQWNGELLSFDELEKRLRQEKDQVSLPKEMVEDLLESLYELIGVSIIGVSIEDEPRRKRNKEYQRLVDLAVEVNKIIRD